MSKEIVKNGGILFSHDSDFLWPVYDQESANEEAWCLSVRDRTFFEIQFLVDFEAEGGDLTQALGTDDCSVCAGVIKRAMEGSRPHMLASYLDGRLINTGRAIWVPNALIHPSILPNLQRNYKQARAATMTVEQIEQRWKIADEIKKDFRYGKATDSWWWFDRDKPNDGAARHGPFPTIVAALLDATDPYVDNEGT